jgi:hypothetical protein
MNLTYTLVHYLYPHTSNNQKPRLLHTSTLFLLSVFLIFYQVILQVLPLTGVKILGYAANIPPDEIIRLTNTKRQEAGVADLQYSAVLSQAAKTKGEHMLANNYWSHVAPDGTEPWKFFTDSGYKYRYAGENLARDFSDPGSAISAWMASPSHKDNMLSGKYKEIGVAVVEGDLNGVETTIIVQLFGTQLVDTTPQLPVAEAVEEPSAGASAMIPVLTPVPTTVPTVVPVAQISPTEIIKQGEIVAQPVQEEAGPFQLLISPFKSTKDVSVAMTILLLVVMVFDGIIIARRKITRVSGRSFAHIAFLGMILAILLIARAGEIL